MALFEFLEKKSGRWLWFFGIFIVSVLPVIFRFFIGHHYKTDEFDIKDLLFGALAMNLSNLNLATGNRIDTKALIINVSWIISLVIVAILAIYMGDDATKTNNPDNLLLSASIGLAVLSVGVSFEANNYTLKNAG
jgi:hypothetical protein